ncbi:hypothetical protein JTB14_035898 [Gonioctena quinquepunctata]|nr:hypothetical protein JTB14_035898 [Gonioctena quinquepunctata]
MNQPELYMKTNSIAQTLNRAFLEKYKYLLSWTKGESILDVGVGVGITTKNILLPYVPEDFKEIVCCDVSEEMLKTARKNFQHPRVSFLHMDISTKDLPSGLENRFDHIFSFFCLHWVQNPKQAFTNLYTMLKPSGEIFLVFMERNSFDGPYKKLSKYQKWSKFGHENFISPFHHSINAHKEWERVLEDAGFYNGICKLEETCIEYEDEKAFEELWRSINPIYIRIPKDDREEYRRDHMNEMKKPEKNFIFQDLEGRQVRTDINVEINLPKKNK